jgi:hypothetical protein
LVFGYDLQVLKYTEVKVHMGESVVATITFYFASLLAAKRAKGKGKEKKGF